MGQLYQWVQKGDSNAWGLCLRRLAPRLKSTGLDDLEKRRALLSCAVLRCLVSSCLALSCLALSCLGLFCLVLPSLVKPSLD